MLGRLSKASGLRYTLVVIDVLCYAGGVEVATIVREVPFRHKKQPCCTEMAVPSLSAERTVSLADTLRVLGDLTRLRILDLLAQQTNPPCVCDITAHFEQNQPTISHHLRLLREAGLIEMEQRGIWSYCGATARGRSSLAVVSELE